MARLSALRHPWQRLLDPYRTRVLCPCDLCPRRMNAGDFAQNFCPNSSKFSRFRSKPLPQQSRGCGSGYAVRWIVNEHTSAYAFLTAMKCGYEKLNEAGMAELWNWSGM